MERPTKSALNKKGQEVPDPVPMAPPIGYKKEPSMTERIRAMVRSEHVRLAAMKAGAETFEEADDFEIGDDYDPTSPFEEVFDPVDRDARMLLRDEEYRAKVEARLGEFKPLVKEPPNGSNAKSDKGRMDDSVKRSEGSGKVGESNREPVDKPNDGGSNK